MENLLPKFPEFFDMILGHQKVFDRFFSKYKPEISEYTFTNLYVWRRARPIKFSLTVIFLSSIRYNNSVIYY